MSRTNFCEFFLVLPVERVVWKLKGFAFLGRKPGFAEGVATFSSIWKRFFEAFAGSFSFWTSLGRGDLINVGGPRGKCVFRGIFAGYVDFSLFPLRRSLRSFNNRGRWKVNRCDFCFFLLDFVY